MGFFSYNCKVCGHPMLSRGATDEITEWMSEVVALTSNGSVLRGEYDGYGRVDCFDGDDGYGWYHAACYEHAGRPAYDGPSASAADQGWFFDDGAHDALPPGDERDLAALVAARNERVAQERAAYEAAKAKAERLFKKLAERFGTVAPYRIGRYDASIHLSADGATVRAALDPSTYWVLHDDPDTYCEELSDGTTLVSVSFE